MASLTAGIHGNSGHKSYNGPASPLPQHYNTSQNDVAPPPMHPASAPNTPIHVYSNGVNGGSAHGRSAGNSPAGEPGIQLGLGPNIPKIAMKASDSPSNFTALAPEPDKPPRRQSLVGFDPLLGGSTVRPAHMSKPPSPSPGPVKAPSSKAAALTKPLTPQPSRTQVQSKQHRRDVQSFCMSDLKTISQTASEEEAKEQRSSSQEHPDNVDSRERIRERMMPTTPKRSSDVVKGYKQTSPKPKNGNDRKDLFTISMSARKESSSNPTTPNETATATADAGSDKEEGVNSATGVSRKLPWVRGRGHRRTKSLETKDIPAGKLKKEPRSTSVHRKKEGSETKTSMYNSIVKDLMDLSFDKLQLPTLAKPMPTSFLTGREGEVMRTCEYEAAPFQMEIPGPSEFVVAARLNEFVENYRRIDQNFDLQEWKGLTSLDLRQIRMVQHIPIAQLLLECGDDVSIQGVVAVGDSADTRVEAVIFEGQQHFIVVIRGTTEQQLRPCPKKTTNRKAVPLDVEHENVEVYQCFFDEYQKIEEECFAFLDKVTEEHPFCDVVFTGHSFGAALSTLAAVRYSNARPMMRVKCYPMASPKVGFSEFRLMVNSSPNLRVMRLEYGQDGKCQLPGQGGSHVGHTLVLHSSLGHNSHKTKEPVLAYKFDAPKQKKFKTTHPDLRSYVVALEEITRLNLSWAKDFVGTSGKGVVVNNEARQMV